MDLEGVAYLSDEIILLDSGKLRLKNCVFGKKTETERFKRQFSELSKVLSNIASFLERSHRLVAGGYTTLLYL